ncbi:radical SAM protein [Alkaliphilus pronyensis]|uniref:Radical SAM protein n=1 Tax=Alkaliphilus pronyensis TaxID=1482732 RepID=A0A6I0F5B0_9FIRM|nr:radical SAM protein [Alkaliphilus pronyensis]KAB3535199.1 radical SAM protein [Alkaliphilus pronyensis]
MSKKKYIIPIFIPHRGCPHDCSFCNQKRIAGNIKEMNGKDIEIQINEYLNLYPKTTKKEIAFYGGSFTGIPINKQKELLQPAYKAKVNGIIDDIRISTRPDYIDTNILKILKDYGVTIIELGVQTTDDEVLKYNKRGHTKSDVAKAVATIKKEGFKLGLQMMLGLAGDSVTAIDNTVKDFINWKPNFVRVYPTLVIKDTFLEELFNTGNYIPYTLEEAITIAKKVLIQFQREGISVIRVGLQTTEEITYGKGVVAGPYHPAFREMVETEIYKEKIEGLLKDKKVIFNKSIVVHCNTREASRVSGYCQSNKNYFLNKYNLKSMKIKSTYQKDPDQLEIEVF